MLQSDASGRMENISCEPNILVHSNRHSPQGDDYLDHQNSTCDDVNSPERKDETDDHQSLPPLAARAQNR